MRITPRSPKHLSDNVLDQPPLARHRHHGPAGPLEDPHLEPPPWRATFARPPCRSRPDGAVRPAAWSEQPVTDRNSTPEPGKNSEFLCGSRTHLPTKPAYFESPPFCRVNTTPPISIVRDFSAGSLGRSGNWTGRRSWSPSQRVRPPSSILLHPASSSALVRSR